MKWKIVADLVSNGADDNVMSINGKPEGETVSFKMLDDDNNLYYLGVAEKGPHDSEEGFEPLDDFGKPNAGCTSIEYLTEKGWETL